MKSVKKISVIMALIMMFGIAAPAVPIFNSSSMLSVSAAAAKKPRLNRKKYTMAIKQNVVLTVVNTKSKVEWTASNKKVKLKKLKKNMVKVTAKKVGKTVVTAKVNGKSLKCKLTIKKKIPCKEIYYGNVELRKGASKTIKPQVFPENTTDKITYSSSDTSVVTVNSKGKLKAVSYGAAYINAKCGKAKFQIGVMICKSEKSALKPDISVKTPSSAVNADKMDVTVTNNGSEVLRVYSPSLVVDMSTLENIEDEKQILFDLYKVDDSNGEPQYTKFTYIDIQPKASATLAVSSDANKKVNFTLLTGTLNIYCRYDTRYYLSTTIMNETVNTDLPPFGYEEYCADILKK